MILPPDQWSKAMTYLQSSFASARPFTLALVLLLPLLFAGQAAQAAPEVTPEQAAGTAAAPADLVAALEAFEPTREVVDATR